ncbi:MAG: NAD-dependent epimerase/dehydratase family protein [Nanoarchaeota archaeon]|nr:NAD-dependent epimerase/dehydratase family protein [Nanoarchaeota archaeon]
MILITGGTGFLGSAVTKQLLVAGKPVRILVRDGIAAKKRFPKVQVIQGDILGNGLREALKGVTTVIHLAGKVSYTAPKKDLFTVNVQGTQHLLDACTTVKRFLFAGSVGVYPKRHDMITEATPLQPKTAYGESKRVAEELIFERFPDAVSLRIAPIYGPGSPIWGTLLDALAKGFPIPKTKNQTHVVHVNDVAQAFYKALTKGIGPYLVADKEPVPFVQFASALCRQLGKEPTFKPVWLLRLAMRLKRLGPSLDTLIMQRHYDISKAQHDLGYHPTVSLQEGVKTMVAWYQQEHLKKQH